jgi:hypothetical protein
MGAKKKRLDTIQIDRDLLLLQLLAREIEVSESNGNTAKSNSVLLSAMFFKPS